MSREVTVTIPSAIDPGFEWMQPTTIDLPDDARGWEMSIQRKSPYPRCSCCGAIGSSAISPEVPRGWVVMTTGRNVCGECVVEIGAAMAKYEDAR